MSKKIRLEIEIDYVEPCDEKIIKAQLLQAGQHLIDNGLLSGDTNLFVYDAKVKVFREEIHLVKEGPDPIINIGKPL